MTREEYMTKLQKYLRKLPKQDYEDAIEYFNEYFSDTDEEGQQRLMEELGTPKEAAADLMYNLLDRKIQEQDESGEEKKSKKGITLLAVLAIMSTPVTVPLFIALLAVTLLQHSVFYWWVASCCSEDLFPSRILYRVH